MRFLFSTMMLLLLAGRALAAPMPLHPEPKSNLTILVDANLMLPTAQLARAYASTTGTPLTVVLKNATDAENQITQGLEAHLLITSNHALVVRLAEHGLTDVNSTRPIARTQLAMVAAHDLSQGGIFAKRISFGALVAATTDMPVYIDDPATPDGARAAKLLTGYEFSEALAARAVVKPTRDEVIASIRSGHGLGLLLAADAFSQPDLAVVSVLPDSISPSVIYEVVVLASESMSDARAVAAFLESARAQEIFSHFGFQPPAP